MEFLPEVVTGCQINKINFNPYNKYPALLNCGLPASQVNVYGYLLVVFLLMIAEAEGLLFGSGNLFPVLLFRGCLSTDAI